MNHFETVNILRSCFEKNNTEENRKWFLACAQKKLLSVIYLFEESGWYCAIAKSERHGFYTVFFCDEESGSLKEYVATNFYHNFETLFPENYSKLKNWERLSKVSRIASNC
jgi:hypothetical protein